MVSADEGVAWLLVAREHVESMGGERPSADGARRMPLHIFITPFGKRPPSGLLPVDARTGSGDPSWALVRERFASLRARSRATRSARSMAVSHAPLPQVRTESELLRRPSAFERSLSMPSTLERAAAAAASCCFRAPSRAPVEDGITAAAKLSEPEPFVRSCDRKWHVCFGSGQLEAAQK